MSGERGLRPDRYAQDVALEALRLAQQALEGGAPVPSNAVSLLDVAAGSPLSYTLTPADSGRVFSLYAEAGVVVAVPEGLPPGFQCAFVGYSPDGLTLSYPEWSTPIGWAANETGLALVPFAVTLVVAEDEASTASLVLVGGTARPDTVTVVYSSGWPTARPYADHVIAVGHTSEPAWLTSADVWLEAV